MKPGYSNAEVADRLGVCTKALYQWRSAMLGKSQEIKSSYDKAETAKLQAELQRVTDERDTLKLSQDTLQTTLSKVLLHP